MNETSCQTDFGRSPRFNLIGWFSVLVGILSVTLSSGFIYLLQSAGHSGNPGPLGAIELGANVAFFFALFALIMIVSVLGLLAGLLGLIHAPRLPAVVGIFLNVGPGVCYALAAW